MKKFLALVAAGCMLFGSAALADGEIELDKSVTTGSTTVSLTVDSSADSYTVTIPSSVVIDQSTQKGTAIVALKAGWSLVSVNGLNVSISNIANAVTTTSGCFYLQDADGKRVNYTITYGTTNPKSFDSNKSLSNYYANVVLINAAKGDSNSNDKEMQLNFSVPTLPAAGTYTDTITFAITTY